MLTALVSKNQQWVSDSIQARLSKKGLIFSPVSFSGGVFDLSEFEKYLSDSDLFGEKYAVVMRGVLSGSGEEILARYCGAMVTSDNEFFLIEEKMLKESQLEIEKAGGNILREKVGEVKKVDSFNIFSLTDALLERDKKKLWVLYTKALRSGKTPEEISGTLFWQLKTLLTVFNGGGKTLSPFVRTKTTRGLAKYNSTEIEKFSFDLVKTYHESRRGGLGLEEKLEQFILRI